MADNTIDILLNARMNVSDAVGGVGEIQKAMRGLTLPKGISADLEKSFSKLTPLLKDYQKQLNKGFSSQKDIKNFNLLKEKIDSVFGDIKNQIREVNGQEVRLKANTQEIDAVKNKIVKAQADLNNALENVFKKNQSAASIQTAFGQLQGAIPKNWTKVTDMMIKASGSFKAGNYAEFNRQLQNTLNYIQKLSSTSQIDLAHKLGMDKVKTSIADAQKYFNTFFNSLKTNIKEANNIESLRTKIAELGAQLEGLNVSALEDGPKAFEDWVNSILNVDNALDQLHNSTQDTAKGMVRMVDEVNELKNSTQYFFSLRNMINLLKRGIDEAVQSVKDLDKAMTDTAVVTDFSVADMWKDLPKYTQIANELGATTQGAYETMTLYYQQGLDQQQAFALGAETMKMARIAGLDYAETTDMMTAALRGFNMELNEVSAKRVNDVYSELAAITASDTEELGTAMQRTASIAHSAGMSFEGTTAFLAQAIETTREPAENIGTAMKTIVARFQEMKKNPLEIAEVDGEEVSYNKVDQALQSIGVSLKDTNGQFRELDQVFLDISQRWDGLTQTQQRYIATIAAGSRQQSRFIAMMDNYDRTVQLMEAANNSAGASDEQFGKTMDSLEAKVNKLHNAWQRFTMGIMNNNMVKGIVDAGTAILTVVNQIIDVLSFNGQSGLIKSILSLATAFTALKSGGKIINSLIGGLGGLVDPQSSFKEGLKGGFLGGRNQLQADRISNPIVKAINGLIPYITKAKVTEKGAYVPNKPGSYSAARKNLNEMLGGVGGFGFGTGNGKYSIDKVRTIIKDNQLNKEQQKNFFQASPGFKKNITNSLSSLMQQVGTEPQVIQSLAKGFQQGDLTLDEVLLQGGLATTASEKIKAEMSKAGKEGGKAAAIKTGKEYVKTLRQQGIQKGLKGKELKDFIRNSIVPTEEARKGLSAEQQLSTTEKIGNALGKAGAGLMQLGSGLQTIGANISTINPQLGQMVTNFGNMLTTAGSAMTALQALSNPLVLAAAAIGTVVALEQARVSKIKKTAEEISESFKEANKTTQENITSLKSYRSELATLSKGVDINGNNVSLSDSEYERYLEIVDEIARLNPKIVDGYNAQGHAIINNNKALEETIAAQEKLQKKALKDYIKPDSLQKLINARNINGTFRGATSKIVEDNKASKWQTDQGLAGTTKVKTAPMTTAAQQVLAEMQKQKGLDIDSILQSYGISLQQLQDGEIKAVNTFVKNQDQINAQVGAAIASSGEEINESLTKSFDNLSEQTAKFDEAVAPVLQNLQTYVSNSSAFKNIAPEFQSALMSGLKDIVIQPDLDAKEMQSQAQLLIKEFDNLSAEGSRYSMAMKQVEEAQNDFAESLDASEYTKGTESALRTLDSLMNQYAGRTDAYSQAIAEYLQTQMDKIRNFTEEGSISLSQALNGVTDTIAAAEGAYSSFQESTKTDLSTGKDSMKSIFDEITKETDGVALHMEKFGDGTMWKGARALLGDKFVEENAENIDAIKKEIRSLEPELKEGEAGFKAFWKNFKQVSDEGIEGFTWNADGSYDIDRNVNPDVYEQIADAMHRSEEYVVAMLNAGKQFADIDFHNVDDVRKALATDEATIKNNDKIFVKSDYYNNALDEAHIYNPNERKNIKEQDKAAGIIEIKNPDQITKDDFKMMGISDLPSLIKSFGDTGQFNRNEIAEYAEALGNSGLIDYNPADFEAGYQHYLDSQEHPELQPIQSIDSTVQQIAGLIDKNNVLEGHYSKEDETNAQNLYDEVIGGKGNDTATQYFGEGKNEFGNRTLTPKEFTDTYAKLGKIAADAEERANTYYQGAKVAEAHGDTETADKMKKIGDLYDSIYKSASANQKEGKQSWVDEYARDAYNNRLKELQNSGLDDATIHKEAQEAWQAAFDNAQEFVKAAEQGELEGLKDTDKNNKEIEEAHKEDASLRAPKKETPTNTDTGWKYGNVTQANRPQGLTDESGKDITVLGGSKAFNIGEGQEVEIAFTPVVTLDGKGDILEDETVEAYINTLIQQLQSEGKEVNLNNLLQLDSTGEIEGFEGIKNVIADMGDNAAITAIQMHALEAGLDLTTINTQYQQLDATIQKVGRDAEQSGQKIEGTNKPKTTTDVQTTTYEVFTAGAEGNLEAVTEKLEYLKTNYPEVYTELITEAPQYGLLEQYSKEIDGLSDKPEIKQTITTNIAGGKVSNIASDINNLTAKNPQLKVGTNAEEIQGKVENLIRQAKKLDTTKTLTLNVKKTGVNSITVDGHTWNITTAATGLNNKINKSSIPIFGSAARGKYGTIGPKDTGGLTLTGERGFEIAWLPSENRSTVLGVGGPQMVNLPSDAVVYNHEQSKEILKRKGIPAGSMDRGSYNDDDDNSGGGSSGKGKKGKKGKKSKKSKNKKSKDKSEKEAPKLFEAVNVWWDNFARRTEAHQRIMDKASKTFEKTLKGFAGTADKAKTALATYQSTLVNAAKENNIGLQQAKNQLYNLDNGIGNDALALISYSATTTSTKKNKKGKKKTTTSTTSQQEFVNLGGYIKYNAALDTYEIDQAQLDAIANLEQRKAIADAANQKLNDLLSKRNKAEEEIQKARDELDKVADTMYETFYSWEKSINEIYMLSKRLEVLSGLKEFNSNLVEFESAMMKTGYQTSEAGQNNITKYLAEQQTALKEQIGVANQLITAREKEFQNALKADTYFSKLQKSIESSDVGVSEEAIADYQAAVEALKIYENANGDMETAIQRLNEFNDKETNKDFYDRVQKVLDDIFQKQNDVVDASSEALKLSGEIFSQIEDNNDYIIDFQNDMLEGAKKQAEEQIDRLDTLNDSLSKALKNLLDEVKRKLDERRRTEDNAKTESEIARKQQRLAMLRADTSGGHQTEIAQLEKEIADSQQNYQRTLEDQLLDRLQEQADKAEQQRQQQIDLLQAANDVAASNGTTMKQIEEWLAKGDEASRNALKEAYRTAQGYYDEDTSQKERERIDNSFEEAYAKYGAYIKALPDWDKIAKDSEFTTDISNKGQTTIGGLSSAEVQTVHEGADKAIEEAIAKKEAALTQATTPAPAPAAAPAPAPAPSPTPLQGLILSQQAFNSSNGSKAQVKALQQFLNILGYKGSNGNKLAVDGDFGTNTKAAFKKFKKAHQGTYGTDPSNYGFGGGSRAAVAAYGYKTGGLADYTGPAWLDGTPSKPELVLNAKDTANFIALKDVLSKAMGSTKSINNSYGGDNIFEININVDKIEKDYDVDRVADRVKKKILESSSYRNVTQVRNFR